MPLQSGDRLGPYEVQALLGVGGMGEVYRGRDTRLGRTVALKVISPRLVGDASHRLRFDREARAASVLNHPAIVTIYDIGEADGVSWIAMEWVDGQTLRAALANGALPLDTCVAIARDIAAGLAVAHANGVVHRDLKPENIMIARAGRAKIVDFGLARQTLAEALHGPADETVAAPGAPTFAGAIMGTVGYMSPEQAAGRPVDFRSDQFAFGLICYEMLAGRPAFAGSTAVETLAAIMRDDPAPIQSLRTGTPDSFLHIIARCLAKRPEDRFGDTSELAQAFDSGSGITSRWPAPSVPAGWTETSVPPRSGWRTRRAAIFAGALAVGLIGAAAGWNSFRQSREAIDSLAVLPFTNASHDPDIEYLGDGITESLIEQISAAAPGLRVMARATAFRFRDAADPQGAGRQLGVGAVVTGSISRRNDRISIAAELVEIRTGARLWGEHYDLRAADLLSVQDRIASEIAAGLRLRLPGEGPRNLAQRGTRSPEAYDFFLQARALMAMQTEDDDLKARRLLQQALEKDPAFVDARVTLASTYARSAGSGYVPAAQAWALADPEIKQVLAADPGNVRARAIAATRRFEYDWDWAGADREYRQIKDDPRLLLGPQFHPLTLFFWASGHPEESLALVERALRVDPRNLEARIMRADFLAQSGRLDEALASYQAITAEETSDPWPLFGLAEVLHRRGDIGGAIEALRKAYTLSEEEAGSQALEGARTEEQYQHAEMAVARVRLADLLDLARTRYVSPLDLARSYALTGDREHAFAKLEEAVAERSAMLVLLKVDRAWDQIRDDPRFTAVVRKVGIP